VPHAPEVHLYKRRGGVTLAWSNLPAGTEKIDIFRTKKGQEAWSTWKTVNIDPSMLALGSVVIQSAEDLGNYYFYTAAVGAAQNGNASSGASGAGNNASGTGPAIIVLWQSSSTVIEPPPPAPGAASSTNQGSTGNTSTPPASSSTQNTLPPVPPPAPPQPTSSANGTHASSTPPQPGSTSTATYYTPSGQISGSGSEPIRPDFWVDHVNSGIEIGWHNLGAGIGAIIVYRSPNQNGPWTELFTQRDPVSPSSIRIFDNTLYTPHYYRMETIQNHAVAGQYGPLFLPPFSIQP